MTLEPVAGALGLLGVRFFLVAAVGGVTALTLVAGVVVELAAGAIAALFGPGRGDEPTTGLPDVGSFETTERDLGDGAGTLTPADIAAMPSLICCSCMEPAGDDVVGVPSPGAMRLGRKVSKSQSLTDDDSEL